MEWSSQCGMVQGMPLSHLSIRCQSVEGPGFNIHFEMNVNVIFPVLIFKPSEVDIYHKTVIIVDVFCQCLCQLDNAIDKQGGTNNEQEFSLFPVLVSHSLVSLVIFVGSTLLVEHNSRDQVTHGMSSLVVAPCPGHCQRAMCQYGGSVTQPGDGPSSRQFGHGTMTSVSRRRSKCSAGWDGCALQYQHLSFVFVPWTSYTMDVNSGLSRVCSPSKF